MRVRFINLIFLLVACFELGAQDIHFTQFDRNPMYLNPALTGRMDGFLRANGHYNTQWKATGTAYNTYGFAIDLPLLKNRKGAYLGLGTNFLKDKAGDSQFGFINAGLAVSGILPVSESSEISLGIRSAFVQRSMSSSNLQWGSQFDGSAFDPTMPGEVIGSPSFFYFDFSTGLNYHFENKSATISSKNRLALDGGVFYNHITKPELHFNGSGDRLAARMGAYVIGEVDIPNTRYFVEPSFLYQQQAKQRELVFGAYVGFKIIEDTKYTGFIRQSSVSMGAQYRFGDAIAPGIAYEMGDFSLKVSYDINLSSLSAYTSGRGGFEVSLTFIDIQGFLVGGNGLHKSFL